MTPTHARAPKYQRAIGRAPAGHRRHLTILEAIALNGMIATTTVATSTSTDVFVAIVQQVLMSALQIRPDSLIAMDNLAPQGAAFVRQVYEVAGVANCYLPSYSPNLEPTEPAWA